MKNITRFTLAAAVSLAFFQAGRAQPQFTDIRATEEGAILIRWQSETNTLYRIQYANALSEQTEWETLTDLYPSHGTNTFALDTGNYFHTPPIVHPCKSPARFYRILNEGTNGAPAPQIAITSPSSGLLAFGAVPITVAASTDQATLLTRLYVDGQEMRPATDSTNYSSNGTNYLIDTYTINSCEWPNGPHILFATAQCDSGFEGPLNSTPVTMGHAVSTYVPVTFSNLITRLSWSEPFFEPALGQTQTVSAVFAANVDWALQMLDASSNAVRTATGSGATMQFPWDGTGQGGTNLPAGVYTYLLSVQTNGLPIPSASPAPRATNSPPPLIGSNAPSDPSSSTDTWLPTSAREAVQAGWDHYFLPLPPMPPVRTNGTWVPWEEVYGLQRFTEVAIPPMIQQRLTQTLFGDLTQDTQAANSGASHQSSDFSGPSSQSTAGPGRPPTAPMLNIVGTYALAYQQYVSPSGPGLLGPIYPTMLPPLDGRPYPPGRHVQLMNSSGPVVVTPMPLYAAEAQNFAYDMWNAAWIHGFEAADGALHADDLRYGGTPFNTNNIGLLLLHGAYGTSADWHADQCQQIYFPLWSFGVQIDGTVTSREEWLRMSEMSFGGAGATGLKWMAIKACYSLRSQNIVSMDEHFIYPFNSNLHLMLGVDTGEYADAGFGGRWARYMTKSNLTVWAAWTEAGKKSPAPPTDTIRFAVWGHSDNLNDNITDYVSSPSGDLEYQTQQVHP